MRVSNPVEVDGAAPLLGDLAGEVDREPERVVEEERVLAVDVAALEDVVEQVEAPLEGVADPFLLSAPRCGSRARARR